MVPAAVVAWGLATAGLSLLLLLLLCSFLHRYLRFGVGKKGGGIRVLPEDLPWRHGAVWMCVGVCVSVPVTSEPTLTPASLGRGLTSPFSRRANRRFSTQEMKGNPGLVLGVSAPGSPRVLGWHLMAFHPGPPKASRPRAGRTGTGPEGRGQRDRDSGLGLAFCAPWVPTPGFAGLVQREGGCSRLPGAVGLAGDSGSQREPAGAGRCRQRAAAPPEERC